MKRASESRSNGTKSKRKKHKQLIEPAGDGGKQ